MFASRFRQLYTDAILELLWKQWSSLGVSGHIDSAGNSFILDPEALLLFSSFFARFDQRLYDLVIEWLQLNGESINIPRLKAILKKFPFADKQSLGLMAALVKNKRWQCFAKTLRPKKSSEKQALFLNTDGSGNVFIPHLSETALLYGYMRNEYVPGNKVVAFDNSTPGTLLLMLRGAFGLSARAEAIITMLNMDYCRIQDVADCGKYTWKATSDALEELYLSGIVVTLDGTKRGRSYFLKDASALRSLFGIKKVVFPDWCGIFNVLGRIYQIFNNPHIDDVSEKTIIGEVQAAFAGKNSYHLHLCGIPALARFTPDAICELPKIIRSIS